MSRNPLRLPKLNTPSPPTPVILQDEAAAAPNLKLLEMAHKWKRQKMGDGDNA